MDREEYIKTVYADYWIDAREKKYGFKVLDKNLCRIFQERIGAGKILDVASGTGYPFADYFQKSGYSVHAIDLAPKLVEKCKKDYPLVAAYCGDAQSLPFGGGEFDAVYCFQSSWYFSDLNRAVSEMIRVCRSGGLVMFDIINSNNIGAQKLVAGELKMNRFPGVITKYLKNIAKIIIGRGAVDWQRISITNSCRPQLLSGFIKSLGVSSLDILASDNRESIVDSGDSAPLYGNYDRLIFIIKK